MRELLSEAELQEALNSLPEWRLVSGQRTISRNYLFPTFKVAIEFVNVIAHAAEEMDHHPDIEIRFHKVRLELTTHSAGGLTQLDLELASRADALAEATGAIDMPGNCF